MDYYYLQHFTEFDIWVTQNSLVITTKSTLLTGMLLTIVHSSVCSRNKYKKEAARGTWTTGQ